MGKRLIFLKKKKAKENACLCITKEGILFLEWLNLEMCCSKLFFCHFLPIPLGGKRK